MGLELGRQGAPPTCWRLTTPAPVSAVTRRLWVSLRPGKGGATGAWEVVGVEAAAPGEPSGRWRVAFEDFKIPGGSRSGRPLPFPNTIRFAEPGRSFDDGVEIQVKDRSINPAFRPQAFTLAPPDGYAVQVVPCPSGPATSTRP